MSSIWEADALVPVRSENMDRYITRTESSHAPVMANVVALKAPRTMMTSTVSRYMSSMPLPTAAGSCASRSSERAGLRRLDADGGPCAEHRCGVWALLVLCVELALGGCASRPVKPQPDFVDLIRQVSPAVLGIGDDRGILGSGFRVEHSRYVVTAAHVVNSPQGSSVVIAGGTRWPCRVVRLDAENDLAVLELASDLPMPGLALRPGVLAPPPGEWIVVLGRPFGAKPTATVGIVSAEPGALLEPAVLSARIQLNAAINPGNSGGPVVNLDGRVIGVANGTIPGGFGLGFATPAEAVRALVNKTGQER